ncbi:hypothetical protein BDZ89DRAFT_422366 [Hymenopellis radicata]|nr:hypothetical protein BDZ89DRAFT_422366 [Hymenopellis radicata]
MSYYPSHYAQLSPRDNYLAALARAKAAEEEYLAAEAIDREERQIRRRLEELQFQKQKASHSHYPSYGAPDVYPSCACSFKMKNVNKQRSSFFSEGNFKKRQPWQLFNSTRSAVSVLNWSFFLSNDPRIILQLGNRCIRHLCHDPCVQGKIPGKAFTPHPPCCRAPATCSSRSQSFLVQC